MQSFKDLRVWRAAMQLVTSVYEITRKFPACESYGLTAQIRRSAVSIPSNIAEGFGRFSRKDEARFLVTARGSLHELDTQLEIARNLGYIDEALHATLTSAVNDVGRMLAGLTRYVRQREYEVR